MGKPAGAPGDIQQKKTLGTPHRRRPLSRARILESETTTHTDTAQLAPLYPQTQLAPTIASAHVSKKHRSCKIYFFLPRNQFKRRQRIAARRRGAQQRADGPDEKDKHVFWQPIRRAPPSLSADLCGADPAIIKRETKNSRAAGRTEERKNGRVGTRQGKNLVRFRSRRCRERPLLAASVPRVALFSE